MTWEGLQDMLSVQKAHNIVHNIVCTQYIWYDYIFVKIYIHSCLNTQHTHFSICGVKEIRKHVHYLLIVINFEAWVFSISTSHISLTFAFFNKENEFS